MIIDERVTDAFSGDSPPRLVNMGVVATYRWAGVPGASDVIETFRAATTFEWWEIDGVSLQTLAWNLRTWGGTKQGTIGLRGEDDVIPGRPGARWRPKQPDSRTIQFEGWVIGVDPTGTYGDEQTFRENWRRLRRLLFTPNRQVEIRRRWVEDGVLHTGTALGQCRVPVVPERTGPGRAQFVADVVLADPFFYGDEVTLSLPLGSSTHEIQGDAETHKVWVEFQNAQTGAQIGLFRDGQPVTALAYSSLANGRLAVIDVEAATVRENGDWAFGKVSRFGRWLMPLEPGPCEVTYTRQSGSGLARIRYRPAWV